VNPTAEIVKRWAIAEAPDQAEIEGLAKAVNIREELARLLIQRGIYDFEEAKAFFRPSRADIHDPFLMKDMDRAVEVLSAKLEEGARIMVFGDYDVDGTTAVSLVYGYLREFTPQVQYYIPDRYAEGYGLSFQGIDKAVEDGCALLITLDCGVKAVEKVAYAKSKGLEVIICDHHRPGPTLPAAEAILNPKREDCTYPYDELCGCGVGFKLMQALGLALDLDLEPLWQRIDLLALAIGADIVPITGENRIFMH
jgi:single-stranded-DNA-specific exonuclease